MQARQDNKRARLATTDSYEIEDLETDSLFDDSMFEDDEGQLDRVDTQRPAKRYKRHRHPAADEYEKIRWMYLCQFNKKGWEKIVEETFNVTDKDGWEFTHLRLRVQDTLKGEDRQRSSISEGDYVQYRDNKKGKVLGIFVHRSLQDIRHIFLYISPSLPFTTNLGRMTAFSTFRVSDSMPEKEL
ncbi:hypothetical protein V8E54_010895 [Elaphomyces granulatus]